MGSHKLSTIPVRVVYKKTFYYALLDSDSNIARLD